MHGRLSIPSIGPNGIYQIKFRCIQQHECKDFQHAKYLTDAIDNRLFNVRAIMEARESINITEGEIDAIVLEQLGHHAVAAPGSNSWKRHHARMFAGFERVLIWGDGDKAGRDFAKSVSLTIPRAVRINCPEGEDVNSLLISGNEQKISLLMGQES